MSSPSPKAPWRRQHIADPWRARWVRTDRNGDAILADWEGVGIRVETRFGPLWLYTSTVYGRMRIQDRLEHQIDDWEETCAALRDAWDMHRQLRALRISATSTRLREIAALAGAGQ